MNFFRRNRLFYKFHVAPVYGACCEGARQRRRYKVAAKVQDSGERSRYDAAAKVQGSGKGARQRRRRKVGGHQGPQRSQRRRTDVRRKLQVQSPAIAASPVADSNINSCQYTSKGLTHFFLIADQSNCLFGAP
jgi:hypothetical protein